ncbi:MAG TPA: ribosome silencing factor [Rhabdochlamydiaceae bacterium]|nr:ribosome silencing factor [Rhabdochlamydiaceae bacterium]
MNINSTTNVFEHLNKTAQVIYDKKGMNILCLDLRNISTITDYAIIAEGAVNRHVVALAQAIMGELAKHGLKPIRAEGMQTGDWVVLDFVEFMVHLFMPGIRDRYQLEELWRKGKIIDLKILLANSEN